MSRPARHHPGRHPPSPRAPRRLRSQDGFTIVEVLVATLILTLGIAVLITTFDSARRLTLVSERQTSSAHRAQWELEKLQAEPYSQLAMISAPTHSTDPANPDYYVNYSSPVKCISEGGGCYAANAEKTSEEEVVVLAPKGECHNGEPEGCGIVSASPSGVQCSVNPVGSCEWKDGQISGALYDFVTWHTDAVCEIEVREKLCTTKAYKRITVIATVNVPAGDPTHPQMRVSTLIADPSAVPTGSVINGKQNPLKSPTTDCGTESCINGIQRGNPQSWFLHDAPASLGSPSIAPMLSHPTRSTVAPSNALLCTNLIHSGCPAPDLMDANPPEATTLYDYSTDQDTLGFTNGAGYGGRALKPDVECSSTPTTTDNTKGEMWVTTPLPAETKLTGYGGMSLYTQTVSGVAATVTLCVAIYDVPNNIENLTSTGTPPTLLGFSSYAPPAWPTTLSELSFAFHFLASEAETKLVKAQHRIGVRIWPAASSTSPIAIAYDTTGTTEPEKPGYGSLVQLNTE